ncbi:hypothetical protein [Nocardioides speluncae]|uniref:hypothetical protein n=1 Tax=Nocardioides speluncae TaxID=2670337 RepID=UPI000D69BB7F|nr:hypothetical protein [Nocardioides speluncae]
MTRVALIGTGLLAAAYGGWLLLDLGWDNLVATANWLVAGVILHDAVLAPVTILATVVLARLLPSAWRAPVTVGAIVLGSLTLLAIPVLGRYGAKADNPTLLDRNYTGGWLAVAALTCAGVAVAALANARRRRNDGQDPGR